LLAKEFIILLPNGPGWIIDVKTSLTIRIILDIQETLSRAGEGKFPELSASNQGAVAEKTGETHVHEETTGRLCKQ
jgi:hypothetical protein